MMEYWDALKQPPKSALKTIKGGRLNGFTDISPQWRLKAMTEIFGSVGFGWNYEIEKLWKEEVSSGEVLCFAQVRVKYCKDGQYSEWFSGVGGNKLVSKEKAGFHASDEGYKMAVTDAIGTALKALGVGASVYTGESDPSKYTSPKKPDDRKSITIEQAQKLDEYANSLGGEVEKYIAGLDFSVVTYADAEKLIARCKAKEAKQ